MLNASLSEYRVPHAKWKHCGLLYYSTDEFFFLSHTLSPYFGEKQQQQTHLNSLIYNWRRFVRSKGKKEWTQERAYKALLFEWGAPSGVAVFPAGARHTQGKTREPGAQGCSMWVREAWVFECKVKLTSFFSIKGMYLFIFMWSVSILKSRHNHISYISSSKQGVAAFLEREECLGGFQGDASNT